MKLFAHIFLFTLAGGVSAQSSVYRCVVDGRTEYTNTINEAQAKDCKLVSGGNVTVVPAPKFNSGVRLASATQAGQRVNAGEQRARDSDARLILESELKKAESRQNELLREYNNGEPEKLGPESRNYQKYLDRVSELKSAISRNESDIAGIRRELARAGNSTYQDTTAK